MSNPYQEFQNRLQLKEERKEMNGILLRAAAAAVSASFCIPIFPFRKSHFLHHIR